MAGQGGGSGLGWQVAGQGGGWRVAGSRSGLGWWVACKGWQNNCKDTFCHIVSWSK